MQLREMPNDAYWSLWICDHRSQMNTQLCRSILLCFFCKFIFLLFEAMILRFILSFETSNTSHRILCSTDDRTAQVRTASKSLRPACLSLHSRPHLLHSAQTHGPCFSLRHWLVRPLFPAGLRGHCDIISASSGFSFSTVSFPSAYKCGVIVSIFKRKTLFLTLFFLSAIFLPPRQKNSLKTLPRLGVSISFPLILFFEMYFNHCFLPIPPLESLSSCPPLTLSLPKLVSVICVHLIRPLSSIATPIYFWGTRRPSFLLFHWLGASFSFLYWHPHLPIPWPFFFLIIFPLDDFGLLSLSTVVG